jgi:hypothetical protein
MHALNFTNIYDKNYLLEDMSVFKGATQQRILLNCLAAMANEPIYLICLTMKQCLFSIIQKVFCLIVS